MDNKLNIFIKSKIKLLNSIKKGYYSKIGKGTKDFKIIQSKNNNLEFGNQLDILSKIKPYRNGITFTIIKITPKNIITLMPVQYFDILTRDFLGKEYEIMAFDRQEFEKQLNRLK